MAKIFHLSDDRPPLAPTFDLKESRIGVCRTPMWDQAGPGTQDAFEKALQILTGQGAHLMEVKLPEDFSKISDWHQSIIRGEGRSSFLLYATQFREQLESTLQDFVHAPIERHPRQLQLDAYDGCARLRPIIDKIASEYDVILCPSVIDEAPQGLDHTGSYVRP